MKLDEPVPTIRFHVCPFFPDVIFQVMVATVPAAMVLPGLFAVNGTELGVALIWVTAANPPDEVYGLADGEAGMGRRLLAAGFCARAIPTANRNRLIVANKMDLRIPASLL